MTVTLEDVFRILRLPITRKPVYQALPSAARGRDNSSIWSIRMRFGHSEVYHLRMGIMYAAHPGGDK
ncbi:hypothetical protein KI387_038167, partial [Taxus chinensis]